MLAPLKVNDDEAGALRKIRVVATYLDILIHRRIWNWRAIDYSTMQYAMFIIMRDIRDKTAADLATMLVSVSMARLGHSRAMKVFASWNEWPPNSSAPCEDDTIGTRSGQASRYAEYAQRGRKRYEIEHVWADHPERHSDEFSHPSEFQEYRNRIGGLLLLPKSFNASYGDLPYVEKREHYVGQNFACSQPQ